LQAYINIIKNLGRTKKSVLQVLFSKIFDFKLGVNLNISTTLVISIEPNPDNNDAPFMFKPLMVALSGATDHVTYEMSNMSANFPSGTATR